MYEASTTLNDVVWVKFAEIDELPVRLACTPPILVVEPRRMFPRVLSGVPNIPMNGILNQPIQNQNH
jgi:hypothetical protein